MKNEKQTVAVTEPPPEPSNSFMRLLQELRDGETLNEASKALQEVVQAVEQHGTDKKTGTITIKLKIAIAGRGNAVAVTDEISIKKPEPDQDATLLYATEDGTLQRENPNQRNLDLRTVEGAAPEEKDLSTKKAAQN